MNNFLLFFLLFNINIIICQIWYPEVKGFNTKDHDNGYAGSSYYKMLDFYLCSERKYRVHYQNEDEWSKEFTACQPVGIGKVINGISISGGLPYKGRVDYDWFADVTLYNISDINGYCGNLNGPITCVAISGGEYYRSAYGQKIECSNENSIAIKTIRNIFGFDEETFYYDKEIQIESEPIGNISVILLNANEINLEGKIIIKVEKSNIIYANYEKLISEKFKKHINQVIDFDFDKMHNFIEEYYMKKLGNGTIDINYKWSENLIEMEAWSKIDGDYHSYRGGYKIIIRLNNDNMDLFLKIQEILKAFFKFFGKKMPKEITTGFKNFNQVEEVINDLGDNSIIAEEIILYSILSPFVIPK